MVAAILVTISQPNRLIGTFKTKSKIVRTKIVEWMIYRVSKKCRTLIKTNKKGLMSIDIADFEF